MRSYSVHFKIICLLSFLFITGAAVGQDLGSSNKLFGGAKTPPSASKKVVKKAPAKAKPKPVVAKAKPAVTKTKPVAKRTISTPKGTEISRPSAQPTAGAKPKFTEFNEAQPTVLTITPAQPKPVPVPVSEATAEKFEDFIEEGNTARDDRNYAAAESAYKSAKLLKPKDSRAVYGLGNLYSDQQRWEDAEASYRAALELDSGSAIAHIALSYVLTQPIAAPDLSNRYEEAEKLARRAIQYAPSNALAFDQLGVAMELRGLIGSETEDAYRKAVQLDPSFAPAYAHLGRLLRRRGLTKESANAYQNAIQRSTDVGTMVLVADVMQSEQRFADSDQLLRKSLVRDPRNQSALLLLGKSLTTQGKYGDAEAILRKSLDGSSNSFMANSLLGSLFTRQGKFAQAESALLLALKFVPKLEKRFLSQQFESLGDGYLKSGNARNAERVYRQAIALDAEKASLAGKLAKAQQG
ncbi:MAG: tetratricopeptide repeat protein [Pyrinomonadaceae bacterium]